MGTFPFVERDHYEAMFFHFSPVFQSNISKYVSLILNTFLPLLEEQRLMEKTFWSGSDKIQFTDHSAIPILESL